ncbi:unnamed protein product [Penicillium salamii]|nr:unnamed protein product [Penicillium salamii]
MVHNIWAVPLQLSNFNIIVSLLGGFISLFGLISYLLKENYYVSEARTRDWGSRPGINKTPRSLAYGENAVISLLVGVAFGPNGANFIRPRDYAECNHEGVSVIESRDNLNAITLNFSRLVLGVQLVLAGVQLPSKYLKKEWKSVLLLVGPGMTAMWITTSLLIWAIARTPSFLHALAVGACVTPTDPVLSAVIVKGKFADHNIPKDLQNLIIAESGTNDGLGYPFLFFALYLVKYVGSGAASGSAGDAMGLWFGFTWGYTIILSILYGAVVGWVGKKLLHWAEERNYVDRESFLVFAIALALFVLGTCGLIGTDDVLACFIAGNTFTWDDWFRLETKDDSLQPTIDMLLNVTIFLWYGAYIPWSHFGHNSVISTWRLVVLGILVLLLRRLPWVFGMHKWIPQIEEVRQAVFVGFFGPIGVSAIFYLFVSMEFIEEHLSDEDGVPRSDVKDLAETIRVVVWFLAVCSIVVHGLSIPLGKMGYMAPRTFGRVLSDEPRAVEIRRRIPVLGKFLVGKPSDIESRCIQRTAIMPDPSDPHHPRSEAGTSSVNQLAAAAPSSAASQHEIKSETITPAPCPRKREVQFPDEMQASRDD